MLTNVREYIEGAQDAQGRAVPEVARVQLRPAGMSPGNYEYLVAGVLTG